jgi:hypothetical protein
VLSPLVQRGKLLCIVSDRKPREYETSASHSVECFSGEEASLGRLHAARFQVACQYSSPDIEVPLEGMMANSQA